jgi:pilus assembly protein Flp/PilA
MFKILTQAMSTSLRCFVGDERGATSIEYAIIASGVAIVIAGAIASLGSKVTGLYSSVNTALK